MLIKLKKYLNVLIFAPIIIAQGKYVRKVTPKLPEASGARNGVSGQGPALRLLIIGDSAAAGVGAETQEQALSGQLVSTLRDKYQVKWQLLAKSGFTTVQSQQMLSEQPNQDVDVIVTSLGVNDVTSNLSASAWLRQQQDLVTLLRQQYSQPKILMTQVPPMHQFPALPQPLRGYLGQRAKQFNRYLKDWIDTQDDCLFINIAGELQAEYMASDGFHPSPIVYKHWAEIVAEKITV